MEVEWTAGWPERRRRRVTVYTGVPALALTVTGMLGPLFLAVEWLPNLVLVGACWLVLRSLLGGERTYRATAGGLEKSGRFMSRSYDWASFDGYGLTDDELVVGRPGWRPTVRCARADIEDVEAVTAALDCYLG